MLICIAAGLLLGMSPSRVKVPLLHSMSAIFETLFALQMAFSSRAFFRLGRRWMAVVFGFFSILLALWAFATLDLLAESLGVGTNFVNGSVALIFALLAWAAGYGARAAFRRRWWVLGALLVLGAIFLGLCVITTGLELVPKGHG
jgi:nitroreductase